MSKVAQILTEKILEQLDNGIIPWIKPWHVELPKNAQSNALYRGINALLLSDGKYLTFNQAKDLGGRIKQGAKGNKIAFYGTFKPKDADPESKHYSVLRYYVVFNTSDIEGLPEKYYTQRLIDFVPNEKADSIVSATKAVICFNEAQAYYQPKLHIINMPKKESFTSVERYYVSLFHELIHWTKKDLDRNFDYATEELVAEIGANLLMHHCGMTNEIEQSASYCAGWSKAIQDKSVALFKACTAATKAVEYILSL